MKATTQIYRLNSGGTVVYNMVEDNNQEITEAHNSMIMEINQKIGLSGKTELF